MVAHPESGLVMLEAKKETLEQRIVRASAFRRPPKRWRHEQAGAKLASIESARSTASFAPRRTARGETMHQDSAGGGEDVGEGVAQYRRTECPGTGHRYLDPRHFCAADFQAAAASARADPVR